MSNILFKSLVNGVITLLVISLVVSLVRGLAFIQVITMPMYLATASCCAVASYFGYKLKEQKTS